jgi:hypothetical protein
MMPATFAVPFTLAFVRKLDETMFPVVNVPPVIDSVEPPVAFNVRSPVAVRLNVLFVPK